VITPLEQFVRQGSADSGGNARNEDLHEMSDAQPGEGAPREAKTQQRLGDLALATWLTARCFRQAREDTGRPDACAGHTRQKTKRPLRCTLHDGGDRVNAIIAERRRVSAEDRFLWTRYATKIDRALPR
jgi:hypothetical protein